MKIFYCLLIAASIAFSCKHEPIVDKFIFVNYGSGCDGLCIFGYKLTEGSLFPGAGKCCDPSKLLYAQNPLSADKQALGQLLFNEFPKTLIDSKEDWYGCPGCDDGDAYYVELTQQGVTRMWWLDSDENHLGGDVKIFVKKLRQTIHDLK